MDLCKCADPEYNSPPSVTSVQKYIKRGLLVKSTRRSPPHSAYLQWHHCAHATEQTKKEISNFSLFEITTTGRIYKDHWHTVKKLSLLIQSLLQFRE